MSDSYCNACGQRCDECSCMLSTFKSAGEDYLKTAKDLMRRKKESTPDQVADYMKTMSDKTGCSVTTVKDGWLLMFNIDWLRSQIESAKGKDFVIFVKSSANSVKH